MKKIKDTGCCVQIKPKKWDKKIHNWKKKPFYKTKYIHLFHIPLNYGQAIMGAVKKLEPKKLIKRDSMCISLEDGLFTSTLLIEMTKNAENLPVQKISGKYFSMIFKGDYKDTGKWVETFKKECKKKKYPLNKLMFWFATCPKCAEAYGGAQTIIFTKIK